MKEDDPDVSESVIVIIDDEVSKWRAKTRQNPDG